MQKGPIPIICIIGDSGSGKTTLIEKLIPSLKKRGLRVGTVKHAVHGFDIGRKGKDSYRHKKAGASLVLVSSPNSIIFIKDVKKEHTIEDLEKFIEDVDIVLAEGFKNSIYPKIKVLKKGFSEKLLTGREENIIAIVSERDQHIKIPVFRSDEIEKLVDFIIEKFFKS